jgi:hypothetical protein
MQTIQAELLAGGDSLPVTADNRLLYIHLLADWHLNARLGRAASAFAGAWFGCLRNTMFLSVLFDDLNSKPVDYSTGHRCYVVSGSCCPFP